MSLFGSLNQMQMDLLLRQAAGNSLQAPILSFLSASLLNHPYKCMYCYYYLIYRVMFSDVHRLHALFCALNSILFSTFVSEFLRVPLG